ncbi:hypothetical protein BDR26DRAFT_806481, partial [Obelidium mucronatum]
MLNKLSKQSIASSRRRRLVRAVLRLALLTALFVLVAFPPRSKLDLQLLAWRRARWPPAPRLPLPEPRAGHVLGAPAAIPRLVLRTFWTRDPAAIAAAARNGSDPAKARLAWFSSWTNLNPAHIQLILDDAAGDAFVKSHFAKSVVDAYQKLPLVVQRADMIRYLMLYEFGGVYADMDTQCLLPVEEW